MFILILLLNIKITSSRLSTLKQKKNNVVLFAKYDFDWDEEDNIFYRVYNFFIYFNRNKKAVYYIGNNSAYQCYGFNSRNDMNAFMNSFQRNASRVLNEIIINNEITRYL